MSRPRVPRHFTEAELEEALAYLQDGRLPDGKRPTGRQKFGTFALVEDVADELIRKSLIGVTRYKDKADILTPWKQDMRQRREVYTADGVADARVRRGMYHRALNSANPELNARDGVYRPRASGASPMGVYSVYDGSDAGEDE